MRMAHRLSYMRQPKYSGLTRNSGGRAKWTGAIRLDESSLRLPFSWKRGRLIFVNSMSDLFHEEVSESFIEKIFTVMAATPQHTYQLLTKRSQRLVSLAPSIAWPDNVWMGVSVETSDYLGRVEDLKSTPARVKFLSLEPLLGPLDGLDLSGIDWVIVGGESGPHARPLNPEWVRSIRDQCQAAGLAFHFKQWGGPNKKRSGRILDDRTWDELPSVAAE